MRSFPSAAGRCVLAACVSLATLVGVAIPFAHAADPDDLKDKQKDVQAQIEQAQETAEEASQAVSKAKGALSQAEAQLATAQGELASAQAHVADAQAQLALAETEDARMQAELVVARANLDQARADVVAGQAALDAQQASVKNSVVSLYQQGPPQLLALSGYLHAQTPGDLIRKMEYADTLVEDESALFDHLHAAELELWAKRADVRRAEQQVAEQADLAAQHLVAVQALKVEADEAANAAFVAQEAVNVTVAARQKAQRKAERAQRQDLAKLAELKRQERKIRAQILAAAAADSSTGFVGADNGFLLSPVGGSVTSSFGYRTHPIYGYWGLHDGTDFGISCGQAMRAVSAGRVISRYYSPVYGNRLYLNVGKVNGHNLTVVYNHATGYRVGVGESVKRGETVGYAGSTGWSTGCHLHFTVLEDGRAVDPMKYL